MGAGVGAAVGAGVGPAVDSTVGVAEVGAAVIAAVGPAIADGDGDGDGDGLRLAQPDTSIKARVTTSGLPATVAFTRTHHGRHDAAGP